MHARGGRCDPWRRTGQPLPPASPRKARNARLTKSLIVVVSAAARARTASTKLGGSLNVTAVVGSATGTGRSSVWAASMYR